MQQFIFEIPYTEPEKAFSVFADDEGSVFLDSNDKNSPHSKFSFICFSPFETIVHHAGKTEIKNRDFSFTLSQNPFEVIQKRLDAWKENVKLVSKPPVPFTNGIAGYFSYELVRFFEKLPVLAQDDMKVPDVALGIYDRVIGFDLKKKKMFFCVIAENKNSAKGKLDQLIAKLDNYKHYIPNTERPEWERSKSRAEYKQDIQTVIDYIHAGDIFQVNLTQRFTAEVPEYFNTYSHYLQLRKVNPAPFSAYLKIAGTTLSSSSPERFLKVANGHVESRPIKGTLPDSEDAAILKASAKDRAENTMIVDLLRNDLSKVCVANSVEVPELCKIESYSGLHHMVSSVTGKLKAGKTAVDALSACFPGGSITGAPKIRAMEIIEELEPTRRGVYCGSIGYLGFDGSMDMNIAIRTLVYKENKMTLSVGGGIVADSDLEAEYQETLVKARKIFESFETAESFKSTGRTEPIEKSA